MIINPHYQKFDEVIGLNGLALHEGNFTNIDALETILDVQSLQFSRSYEYHRKDRLLRQFLLPQANVTTPLSSHQQYQYWAKKDTLELILRQWEVEQSSELEVSSEL